MPPQHRGHLAVANLEARFQDNRHLFGRELLVRIGEGEGHIGGEKAKLRAAIIGLAIEAWWMARASRGNYHLQVEYSQYNGWRTCCARPQRC